jgi:hypothetical protein
MPPVEVIRIYSNGCDQKGALGAQILAEKQPMEVIGILCIGRERTAALPRDEQEICAVAAR